MKITFPRTALFLFGLLSACASASGPAASTSDDSKKATAKTVPIAEKKARTEDLSSFRPKFPELPETNIAAAPVAVTPVNHVNAQVDALLDTLAAANKNIKYAQGYRILAYTGSDRKQAMDIRRALINSMPQERDYLTFSQPTYKLKIGDFYSRMEANTVLQRIKNLNPNASIITDQINVNRPK